MTGAAFRKLALALAGTTEQPHFDRAAFRTERRIFATLSSDGKDANVKVEPDVQGLLEESNPRAFMAIANKWGAQGWTKITLSHATEREVQRVLADAHALALPLAKKPKERRGSKRD
jgi:predicted DNA-binding protein (MmcQ/YjbR family)